MGTKKSDRDEQTVSSKALAVLGVLRAASAIRPDRALIDKEIAKRAHIHKREVIDLAKELAEKAGVAVLASCGARTAMGRYIEEDAMKVRGYGELLHKRAAKIHARSWIFKRLADRMEAEHPIDGRGQMGLFA
jgi:hypothetical protein